RLLLDGGAGAPGPLTPSSVHPSPDRRPGENGAGGPSEAPGILGDGRCVGTLPRPGRFCGRLDTSTARLWDRVMKMHRATRSLIPQPLEPAPNSTRGESRTPRSPLAARLAAVAVAVVTLALTASWSHAFGQEARSRDPSAAAFLQAAVAPATPFDRSSGGRLTLDFGSLPPCA